MTCGESEIQPPPTQGPGPGPPASGPLTDEQRMAVLKECKEFVSTLGDLKSDAAQQVLVAWLKTRPEFEEADTLGGNVWAYFHDGRLAMIIPNWRGTGENDGGRIGQPSEGGRKKKSPAAGRTSGQPGSNQVKMFFGFGRAFRDYRPFLKSIFSNSDTEYSVTLENATVENLKNTNDLGVFYIDTHGGLGLKKPREERKPLFGLWTSDTTSLKNDSTYAADLNSYYLVYMLGVQNDARVDEWHYGITEHFVRNHAYMNLAENAVIYIDACNGMKSYASEFRKSIIGKAKGGKATYIGWTALSDGNAGEAAAGFIFDRMLGTNMDINAQDGTIAAEDPTQRPFDFSKIFDDLGSFQVGSYPLGVSRYGGRLAYQSVNLSEIILTPSIEYFTVDEYESRLYIEGLFGDYNSPDGIVTVGGVSVPVIFWGNDRIICELPTVGPGSIGDVIVAVRGNKSNVVPLNEWIIPLELEKEEMSIKLQARLNLRIRGDLHPYRSKPGEAPKKERPDDLGVWENPNNVGFPFNFGSTGNFNVGGQRHATCQIEKCSITQTESASSRSGILPYALSSPGLGFGAYYKWAVDMKTLHVSLHVKVPDVGHEFKSSTACPGQPTIVGDQSVNAELGIQTTIDLPVLKFHFDENYNIKRGQFIAFQEFKWGLCQKLERIGMKAVWPDVSPAFPRNSNTEARVGGN